MEFQIEQNYGNGSMGWIYFQTDEDKSVDELKSLAVKEMRKDWESIDPALYFSEPQPARPTIHVCEYKDGRKVKGGIRFKTKWR